jgi:hypothetical protein
MSKGSSARRRSFIYQLGYQTAIADAENVAREWAAMSWQRLMEKPETDTTGRLICSGNHGAGIHIARQIEELSKPEILE